MENNGVANVDYVAWNTKDAVDWVFGIDTESTSAEGLDDESIAKIETLFTLFDSFIVPIEVEYWVDTVSPTLSPEETLGKNDFTKRSLKSESSVSFEEVAKDIESVSVPSDRVAFISKFEVKRSKTKLFLRDGDVYVDHATPDYYKMWSRGEVVSEKAPLKPVVTVSLSLTSRVSVDSNYSQPNGEAAFRLGFGSNCFIWFEDTPIGRVNKNRLGELLQSACRLFDCIDARIMCDFTKYSEGDAARIVTEDLRDEMELIAEAEEYLETKDDS